MSVHVKKKGKNGLKEVWRANTWLLWFCRERGKRERAQLVWGRREEGEWGEQEWTVGEGDEERCSYVLLNSGVLHLICVSGSGCDS